MTEQHTQATSARQGLSKGSRDITSRVRTILRAPSDASREVALGVQISDVPIPAGDGTLSLPDGLAIDNGQIWIRSAGGPATMGITAAAQEELGETVHVDLPPVGAEIRRDDTLASIETVMTLSDVTIPVDAIITGTNDKLSDHPELLDTDPTASGWLCRVAIPVRSCLELTQMIRAIGGGTTQDEHVEIRAAAARSAKSEALRWYALTDDAAAVQLAAIEGSQHAPFLEQVLENTPTEAVAVAVRNRIAELAARTPAAEGIS